MEKKSIIEYKKATISEKFLAMLFCYLLFAVIYGFGGWYASRMGSTETVLLKGDEQIPFLPWTIIPYMSSGVLFIAMFFFCRSHKELRLLTLRTAFVTVIAGTVFFLFPFNYGMDKPDISTSMWNKLFSLLTTLDTPYNQIPSLHICYAVLMADAIGKHLRKKARIFLYVWLVLMVASTLTTYQHHLADLISAFILMACTYLVIPGKRERNQSIGLVYLIVAFVFSYIALRKNSSNLWLLYPCICLVMVGRAYFYSNSHFLKQSSGNISLIKRIVYLPFIVTNYILWSVYRGKVDYKEVQPGILSGARLTDNEAKKLLRKYPDLIIIDLSAEIEEIPVFKNRESYYCFPLLDIADYSEETMAIIVDFIAQLRTNSSNMIYIHCMMGHWRSSAVGSHIKQRLKEKPVVTY